VAVVVAVALAMVVTVTVMVTLVVVVVRAIARHQINIGILFKYMIYFMVLFTWVRDNVCWCSRRWSYILM
jgi:hypothetical protein